MNLTKLNRRIVRETDTLINGIPVIVSLEPGGHIGLYMLLTRELIAARNAKYMALQRRKQMRLIIAQPHGFSNGGQA